MSCFFRMLISIHFFLFFYVESQIKLKILQCKATFMQMFVWGLLTTTPSCRPLTQMRTYPWEKQREEQSGQNVEKEEKSKIVTARLNSSFLTVSITTIKAAATSINKAVSKINNWGVVIFQWGLRKFRTNFTLYFIFLRSLSLSRWTI